MLRRTNTVSSTPYAADPAILAWQLGNLPAPTHSSSEYSVGVQSRAELDDVLTPSGPVSAGNELFQPVCDNLTPPHCGIEGSLRDFPAVPVCEDTRSPPCLQAPPSLGNA